MFRQLESPPADLVEISINDRAVRVAQGANLAAALLQAGFGPFRTTPVSGAARAPYCMMGVCFDCLATVDGQPNRQTCLETVRAGMIVRRQDGAAKAAQP